MVDEASRGKIATAGLNLLFLDVPAGGEILGRGLEWLYLLGYFLVHYVAAGVHQGIIEPVVEPLLVHGAEGRIVVQDKSCPGISLICMKANHALRSVGYPAAG